MGILQEFKKNKCTLVVSLPANSLDMAKAAVAGGADALKVHLNIEHQAAKIKFGSFTAERANLEKIVKTAKIPVGIVPGDKVMATEEEFGFLERMGIDFFDVLAEYAESWMFEYDGMTRMIALNERYSFDRLLGLAHQGAEAVEAAIVPHSGYGERMQVGDLQHYLSIASVLDLPILVPTQRAILPEEIPVLTDTGVKGIMIGAIVTGKTARSIEKATADFRAAIDALD